MFFTISHVFFFGTPKRLPEVVNFFVGDAGKVPSDAEAFLLDAEVAFRERRMKKKVQGRSGFWGD